MVAIVAIIVKASQIRLGRRIAEERRALLALTPGSQYAARVGSAGRSLPAPRTRVRTITLFHGGTFCTSPTEKPSAIDGAQLFTADPPGFVCMVRSVSLPARGAQAESQLRDPNQIIERGSRLSGSSSPARTIRAQRASADEAPLTTARVAPAVCQSAGCHPAVREHRVCVRRGARQRHHQHCHRLAQRGDKLRTDISLAAGGGSPPSNGCTDRNGAA